MKKLILFILPFLIACSSPKNNIKTVKKESIFLVKLFSTPQELKTPESVLYYPKEDLFFVSNINGKPSDFDNNGFISKIKGNEKILNLKWVEGLNAPKGMGIFNDTLYVTDINRVAKIDISTGKILKFYKIPESKFLNDIIIDEKGNVYISDMVGNKIYLLSNEKTSVFIDSMLKSPNGLEYKNNKLFIGNNDYILAYDIENKTYKIICQNTGSIDGLKIFNETEFIISDWSGNVNIISKDCKKNLILSTSSQKINAADFEYVKEKKLLLIPTFFNNNVTIYQIN